MAESLFLLVLLGVLLLSTRASIQWMALKPPIALLCGALVAGLLFPAIARAISDYPGIVLVLIFVMGVAVGYLFATSRRTWL